MKRPSSGQDTLGRKALGVRRQAKEDPVFSAEKTPAGGFPRKTDGYVVLKALMDATIARGIPAPDERLKSIVGAQIRALLRGGYDPLRVRHFAVELGLSWDNAKGHQRLLTLRQVVLQDAVKRDYEAHDARTSIARDQIIEHQGVRFLGHVPVLVGESCRECGKGAGAHQLARKNDLRPIGGISAYIAAKVGA